MIRILAGDCRAVMAEMPEASVDSIVTDPPYELGFMGKGWDSTGVANNVEMWREALRVLKPGGHLLAFSGTRTYHRMVCAIEDAGFEIRDQIGWLYGSGFPKSLDVSKAIDKVRRRDYVLAAVALGMAIPGNNLHDWTKAQHAPGDKWWERFKELLSSEQWGAIEREVVGVAGRSSTKTIGPVGHVGGEYMETAPATDAARQWQGWGTALKPAFEPIVVARKPLIGTVAANVLQFGTGALNIDGCRVDSGPRPLRENDGAADGNGFGNKGSGIALGDTTLGRWPANIIHDGSDEVLAAFPQSQDGVAVQRNRDGEVHNKVFGAYRKPAGDDVGFGGGGSAARFFYTAKANGSDRNDGGQRVTGADRNHHPTVKPTDLMRYLCRLVTPPVVWYCPSCDGWHSDSTKTADSVTPLRGLRDGVPAPGQPEAGPVLQQGVREQRHGTADEAVRAVRHPIQADAQCGGGASESLLQSGLFGGGDGFGQAQGEGPANGQGLRDDPCAGAFDGKPGGLCHGAPPRDGAEALADVDRERGRPSHQREQGGQPAGEPRANAEDASRPSAETEAEADPVSPLRRVDRGQRTCPKCEGYLATRAGVVLDPFAGSGSTLKAAELEGFSAIGIEIDPAYIEIAKRRIASDAPLFAEVAA